MTQDRSGLTLRYDVKTFDGELLLPAGTRLDRDVMQELACRAPARWPEVRLLDYGTVRIDLRRFLMSHSTYRNIFPDAVLSEGMEAFMETVALPLPVLQSLSFFEHNDYYTYRHILMVFALYALLAYGMRGEMGATTAEVAAGPMHDLGKICVPLSTLKSVTPLRRAQRDEIQHHAEAGYVLLTYYLRDAGSFSARVARDHHERRDGSGYPLGITLEERQVETVAVCDVYDALINPRPYRKQSYDNRTALEVITEMAETGTFSWDIVRRLVAANRKERPAPEACAVSLDKRGTPPAKNNYGIIKDDESGSDR